MLVGRTMSGKTAVLRTLAAAMSSVTDDPEFVPVHVHTMNPKSITQGQLYGNFDENTHEVCVWVCVHLSMCLLQLIHEVEKWNVRGRLDSIGVMLYCSWSDCLLFLVIVSSPPCTMMALGSALFL